MIDWRAPIYKAYVTTGQSAYHGETDASEAFRAGSPWIRRVVQSHFPLDRTVKVVDFGCGHGGFIYELQRMGYDNAIGVDISLEQVQAAEVLGVKNVLHRDALEYAHSLDDGSVNVVLTVDLLEHLPGAELIDLAEQIHRILAADGRWILHVPNGEGVFGMAVRYGDLTHRRAFTPSSVRQLCNLAGFHAIKSYSDDPVVYNVTSLCRRVLWKSVTLALRVLYLAEVGMPNPCLTRNLLSIATKASPGTSVSVEP